MRLVAPLAVGLATLILAAPALAADMDAFGSGDGLRSGYSDQWDNSDANDPLTFQTGLRYWYSMGAQNFSVGDSNPPFPPPPPLGVTDTSHAAEAFFRVDDNSTRWYASGVAGASFLTSGSSTGLSGGSVDGGQVGYLGGDVGYSWLPGGKNAPSFGPFAGYMYWRDSPNASPNDITGNYTTATSASDIGWDHATGLTAVPGDSQPNNIEMSLVRLGLSGTAHLGDYIDISGEAAAVPYVKMHGTIGSDAGATYYYEGAPGSGDTTLTTTPPPGTNIASIQSSPTTLDGWGYGAMVQGLIGFHPTPNMTLRLGGRAWYVQGRADATFSRAEIGNPTESDPAATPPNFDQAPSFSNQGYITRDNPWSVFRYGLLAEFSYQF